MQAAFTGLANDEAYYHMFAQNLDWGYFDHPPLVAFLVWMGNFIGGELGVRFFVTLLQPIYIYALWRIIRPADYSTRDVPLFVLIAAAMPILQLYGFIATPDTPLMLFTGLFLLCYKKFTENNSWGSALLLGVMMAGLAYSKYQGALVVAITVLSNVRLLKNPKFYAACLLTLLLIFPHLRWQHQHDWVSFRYHLIGRNRDFEWSFVTEYILNIFAIFNPFLFPVFLKGWWKSHAKEPVLRAMNAISMGFILFFLASTAKGYAQPQWVIPTAFGIVAILFLYAREKEKLRKYTRRVAYITIALVMLVRIEAIFNPLRLKFEIFDNEVFYGHIAAMAAGRPVIFEGHYTDAAKYNFYTGGFGFANPSIQNRTSQYELMDDSPMFGRPVIMGVYSDAPDVKALSLANGRQFTYIENENYIPVWKIAVEMSPKLPESVSRGETLRFHLSITNPYPYTYDFGGPDDRISLVFNRRGEPPTIVTLGMAGTLEPYGTLQADVSAAVPATLNLKKYTVRVMITNTLVSGWYNNETSTVKVKK